MTHRSRSLAYQRFEPEKLILRDQLALDRTILANERTVLAYERTATMLFVTALTLVKLFQESPPMVALGYAFMALAFFLAVMGYFRFRQTRRILQMLRRDSPDAPVTEE